MPVDYRMLDTQAPARIGGLIGQIQPINPAQAQAGALQIQQAKNTLAQYAQEQELQKARRNALAEYYKGQPDKGLASMASLSPEAALELDKMKRGVTAQIPSAIKEWQYFNSLAPEQQQQYLTMKRAQPFVDTGAQLIQPSQVPGQAPQQVIPREVPPEQQPELKRKQERAVLAEQNRQKRVEESVSQLRGIGKQKETMQTAIQALRDGATTGVISQYLPSFRASTIALETAQKQMGLDTLATVTMGALSNEELKLLLTKDIPSGMGEKDLLPYLEKKYAALEKAEQAMYDFADHYASGGSTDDWVKQQREKYKIGKQPKKNWTQERLMRFTIDGQEYEGTVEQYNKFMKSRKGK